MPFGCFFGGLIDSLVDKKMVEVDYLQVFELTATDAGGQKNVHSQEVPAYYAEYTFEKVLSPINVKLYAIDDGEYCTMLLSEER